MGCAFSTEDVAASSSSNRPHGDLQRRLNGDNAPASRPFSVLALDEVQHRDPTQPGNATDPLRSADLDNDDGPASPDSFDASVPRGATRAEARRGGAIPLHLASRTALPNPLVLHNCPPSDPRDATTRPTAPQQNRQFSTSSNFDPARPDVVSPRTVLGQSAEGNARSASDVMLCDLVGGLTTDDGMTSSRQNTLDRADQILRRSPAAGATGSPRAASLGPQLLSLAAMAELDDGTADQRQQRRSTASSRSSRSSSRSRSGLQRRGARRSYRATPPEATARGVDDDDVRRQSSMSVDEMLGNVGILTSQ